MGQTERVTLPLSTVIPTALFHDGPFRWRTAARLIDESGWLQFDPDDLAGDLAEKAQILETDRADAFVVEPGSEHASAEAAALIDAALRAEGHTGLADDHQHPLERAARAIHEDLIVMERRDHGWVMTAGVVCFPTRWSPAEKIGRSMAAIHAPVPDYDTIESAVDRLFDRLRPGVIVWRPNWSIVGEPDLRLPVRLRQAPSEMPADPAAELWLRTERQTLRRLEQHDDAILFTIRIHRWPLGEALAELDDSMAAELRALPDAVAAYKNLDSWRFELADRLDSGLRW